jgi:hypothetical protein
MILAFLLFIARASILLGDKQKSLQFFFVVLGFELTAYTLSHSTSPFFVMGVFEIGCSRTFCPGWL